MKRYTIEQFTNPGRKKENLKRRVAIAAMTDTKNRRVRKRKRHSEETLLLLEAIMRDLKRLESEGILEKNGRKWKFNLR